MGDHDEQVLAFVEITQADPDLAAVFLKHNDWEIAPAVEEYMNNPGRYMVEAGAADADETVRQPLAPIVSRLADDEYDPSVRRRGKRKRVEQAQSGASEGIFDALRDLKSEADYFKHLKNVGKPEHIKHQQKLADLYRPPHAIIAHGNFEEVNEIARTENKWLLVNVHQSSEFECLRINRDVWSKQPIQQLVRDYFVLWYIYTGTSTAKHYTSYYTATDWPHVAVLDPCTGERLAVFEGSKYSEGSALDEALNAFVAKHIAELSARTLTGGAVMDGHKVTPSASDTSSTTINTTTTTTDSSGGRAVKRRRLADDEEERMMNMAIMASLGEDGTDLGTDGEHKEHNNHSAASDAMKSRQNHSVSDNNSNTSSNNTSTHNTSSNNTSTHNTSTTSSNNNNAASTPNTHSTTTGNNINNTTTAVVVDHVTAQNRILSRNNSNITINSNAVTTTATNTSTPSSSSSAPQLQIQLRLPSSRTQPLSYSADTPLHVLLSDVAALLHLSASRAVTLSSNYPRRTFTAQQGTQSLSELGIEHKSVLFVDVSE